MTTLKSLCTIVFVTLLTFAAQAQSSPEGVWKTVDDETGEVKSHVEIYEQDGKYYGKIVKVLKEGVAETCTECPGNKKNQKILGLVIIEDLKPYKDYWDEGTILDPENGKEYGFSVWYEGDKTDEIKIRGKHWTGLYRTQTWYRVK